MNPEKIIEILDSYKKFIKLWGILNERYMET